MRFERIGPEQGFLGSSITCLLQDSKGYIWIGTNDGLNKFDGYTFTKYKFDPFDSNSLSQNLIYTIWEDKEGFIWTSTFEGLCKFDRNTEKFTRFKPDPDSEFNNPNISAINEDSTGTMWLGGASGQLGRFDKHAGKFYNESFNLAFQVRPGDPLLHDNISCIYLDNEGILWVGNHKGLHKLNIQSEKRGQPVKINFTHYVYDPGNPNSISSNSVGSIFEDHSGVLWISTTNGLNSFNKTTNEFKHYYHDPANIHSISTNVLAGWWKGNIVEDPEGNLWISTTQGLNLLNKSRTAFTAYTHDPSDENSISNDHITSVLIDRSGILWVSSQDGVLNKANLIQKPFGLEQHDPHHIHSLSDNRVTALLEDASGIIWIGTDGGGLNRWDKKNDRFTHYRCDPGNPKTLRYDTVYAMLEDREENLWICNGDNLSLLNKQTGEFTHYNSNSAQFQDFDHLIIFDVTEDNEGLIWLGTGNGIKSFDKTTREFRHYYHNPLDSTGISDYTAQTIFADSKDNIWVGYGSIGTDRLDKKTGLITHYKHNPHDITSISSNVTKDFYQDSEGNIWLATNGGGLCRFDYITESFTTFTEKHGLADNLVFSILEDNQNNLWLGTADGISRFDLARETFTNYDYKDGLQGNFFAAGWRVRPARFKGRDGILYLGGRNGFNFFDPAQIHASSQQAPVVITQFKLFDMLVKGANESKEIVLRHDENYFSFEFASLSFYNADKNQYAYKLDGVDKGWVYSGSRRYAGYTDIGPGKYIFRVKATNNDGVWNEEGTSVSIIIHPPWWRTWWAYSIYGLWLVIAGLLVHKYQKQKVIKAEREKARRKELEQAREIEKAYTELKSTQAQLIHAEKMASLGELTAGIAHEIQNPLNFVNNFSELNDELLEELKVEVEKGNYKEALELISDLVANEEKIAHHGKRAESIVKAMLQHSRGSSGTKEPTDLNALCDEYLRLAYHGMRARDKSFNAHFETDFEPKLPPIKVNPQELGRVILNLINNAFYAVSQKQHSSNDNYSPKVSIKTILISPLRGGKGGDFVEIRVTDNGPGIPSHLIDKIFQPFFTTKPTGEGTGLGLSLAYDIVTKGHGGEMEVSSVEGKGTEFIIRIKTNTGT